MEIHLKVVLSTLAFTAFELPPNGAIGTKILEFLFHSRSDLVRSPSDIFDSCIMLLPFIVMNYVNIDAQTHYVCVYVQIYACVCKYN